MPLSRATVASVDLEALLFTLLLLGFLLGLRHATDPDHVVAVTTIVAVRDRRPWAAALVGALWGVGHTATIFVVGGAIIVFDVVIPPRVGLGMELAVAIMLVALGATNLARLRGHAHPAADAHSPRGVGWRPLLVGVVHGLAGSAAAALLVLATIHDARWALLYLGVFGAGTIAGMMTLTTALGLPFAYASRRLDRLRRWLAGSTGLASVAFGGFLAYELVVVHGLLSAAPQWSPQ
jgi:sulfite exporter TauE/SafE